MKSILNQIRIVFLFITILIMSSAVYAQNEEEENADAPKEQSSSDKAQEAANNLANPNATIGFLTFPTDLTWYKGDLPGANDQTAFRFNFQPSLPYKLGEGRNLFVRPLIPVIIKQPVYGENGFEDKGVALGDISIDVAYGKSWKGGFITMFGGFVSMPTATDDNLGSNRWLMGPELVFGKVGKWGSFYTLFFHSWSVSGNEEGNMSALGGQYFYTINLKNAWQIQGQPVFAYNHKATEGNKFTFPVGTGISKTVMIGNMPIKFGVQYWYYLASPDSFGKQSQIRFLITPVVPLPW